MKNTRQFGVPLLSSSGKNIVATALLAAAMLAVLPSGWARPYASSLTNDAGTISFRLNESADSVKVVSGGVTNDLGALAAGLHTFPLGISGSYQVEVAKASAIGYTTAVAPNRGAVLQISTDSTLLRFVQPRGLTVNRDPISPEFGRVYVANATNASTTTGARPVEKGIYMLNADLSDAVGQGNTARTGGIVFAPASSSVSPYRVNIGQDRQLYITDWSDVTGSLYVTDPSVSDGSGRNVLGGPVGSGFPVTSSKVHGSIAAAHVEGSLATADLAAFVIDEDYQTNPDATAATERQAIWRHDVGGSLPGPFVPPTLVALHQNSFLRTVGGQVMDMARGPNRFFYVSNYRSSGDQANVWVVDTNNLVVWNSLTATRELTGNPTAQDLLRATGGLDVSPAGDYLAIINIETNGIYVLPIVDGIPDIANRLLVTGFTTAPQGREVAFDLAGNLYAVSQGAQLLRVFSPGGTSTAVTGSDGTFNLVIPPAVKVIAEDSEGNEDGDPIVFNIFRTISNLDQPLIVNYTLTGTAGNGTDYPTNVLSITIPAGETNVLLVITPANDAIAEFTETVTLSLVGTAQYNLGTPFTATGTIGDNEPPTLSITANGTEPYERFATNGSTFTIERRGATNGDVFVVLDITGTAVTDVDYIDPQNPNPIYMPVGAVTTNFVLSPIDDSLFEGNETVIVTFVLNGYEVVGSGSATMTIIDDECPPETVLFGDNFNTDSSAFWMVKFGANTNVVDYTLDWVFDYSTMGIPPAPGSGGADTTGLRMTVNKNDTQFTSAGLNLYPAGQTFAGDFALRFDLFIDVGNSNSTEHTLAGINHSGVNTNRVSQTPANHITTAGADGIWFAIEAAAGNLRDYGAYTSTNAATVPALIRTRAASTLTRVVTRPPYSFAGSPGNASNSVTKTWAQVEVSQVRNIITLKVNKRPILEVTNIYGFNHGNIMIGYNDQFDSRGSVLNFAIFDNVRVVRLGIAITDIEVSGNTVQLDFTSSEGEQAGDFRIESASVLAPDAWFPENSASIAPNGDGFRATVPSNGAVRFYRVAK